MTKFDDEDVGVIGSDSEKETADNSIGVGRFVGEGRGGENSDGDSDVPEEVNMNDESIKMLKELHNQIKSSTESRRIKSSKKNSKALKSGTAASEHNKARKEKMNDEEEIDVSVMEFLDTIDEVDSKEEEEEKDKAIKNRNNKTKVRDSDVTFRIDKDAIRSRKLGSITVATISENSSSTLGSIYDAFPMNSSVLSFNSSRHNSRERVSLSRFNSLKQVGPSKLFSKSKNK